MLYLSRPLYALDSFHKMIRQVKIRIWTLQIETCPINVFKMFYASLEPTQCCEQVCGCRGIRFSYSDYKLMMGWSLIVSRPPGLRWRLFVNLSAPGEQSVLTRPGASILWSSRPGSAHRNDNNSARHCNSMSSSAPAQQRLFKWDTNGPGQGKLS